MIKTLTLIFLFALTSLGQSHYETLSQMETPDERDAYMANLSVSDQVDVWATHIDYVLAHEDLSFSQVNVVEAARDHYITSAVIGKQMADDTELKEWADEVRNAFENDPDLYQTTFLIPGNKASLTSLGTCGVVPEGLAPFNCNCNWSIGCTGWLCATPSRPCTPVINCGPFRAFHCYYYCMAG